MSDELEEPGWRVRMGCSLLQFTPMSDERRAAFDREEERERAQLEQEAARRREEAAERAADLAFRGVVPRTPAEVFEQVSYAQDRQDALERRREREAAEILGKPRPTVNKLLHDAKAEREARQAVEEATPVSKAELGRKIQSLKDLVGNTFGKRVP